MFPVTSDRAPVGEPVPDPNKRWMFIVALLLGIVVGGLALMIGSDVRSIRCPLSP